MLVIAGSCRRSIAVDDVTWRRSGGFGFELAPRGMASKPTANAAQTVNLGIEDLPTSKLMMARPSRKGQGERI